MKKLLFFFLILCSNQIFGQGFDVSDTLRDIHKPINSSTPPHDYIQLINNSGQDISIRWKMNTAQTYFPPQWEIGIQDRDAYHFPVSVTDSADIVLPDTATSIDKIILNVYQNATAGQGVICITLINLDSIDQQMDIYFVIDISGYVGVEEVSVFGPQILQNPVGENLQIINLKGNRTDYKIISLSGQLVGRGVVQDSNAGTIDIGYLPEGVFILQLEGIEYSRKGILFVKKY